MIRNILILLLASILGFTLGCSDTLDSTAHAQDSHSSEDGHDHSGHDHGTELDNHADHDNDAEIEESADPHAGHEHAEEEHPTVAVTLWTAEMELFMEYPVLVAGESAPFIIHLTHLNGFQAVTEGQVELVFTDSHGHGSRVRESILIHDGIFEPTVRLDHAGEYAFTLNYDGDNCKATFEIDGFVVARTEHDLPHSAEPEEGPITFLKEQQWKVPFATTEAELRQMRSVVTGVATIDSPPDASYTMVAPVAGIVSTDYIPTSGQEVRKGNDVLALLPQLDAHGSWADVQAQMEQAASDWDRAQRLFAQNAISEREYDQVRLRYETLQAGLKSVDGNSSEARLNLKSPVSATVAELLVTPGEAVESGQPLVKLVQRDYYRITAQVYQLPEGGAESISGLSLYLPERAKLPVVFNDITPVAAPVMIDQTSQTIPVQFDIQDVDARFHFGQRLRVDLYGPITHNALSVPESSLYLEEGMDFVLVQMSGESFEKRFVMPGDRDGGWIAVEGELQPGERVVSVGGYYVKLAGLSGEIGHGHAH
jgi:membrane fusion protein, heavy metal efflux system